MHMPNNSIQIFIGAFLSLKVMAKRRPHQILTKGSWREAMLESAYLGVSDWLDRIGAYRNQLFI